MAADDLVLVFQGPALEAKMARGILENKQIPSLLKSKHGAGFVLWAGDLLEEYYLYVRAEDEKLALDLLAVLKL